LKEREAPATDRLIAIDVLRGFAIAWVVLFHLWGDLEFFPGAPHAYYDQLRYQVSESRGASAIFTSVTDLFFRDGFQGVPLFMMISGISLTIAAYRTGDALRWPRFFAHRFRKLLAPYWAGVALTYGVMALIAWRQVTVDGGDFGDQFTGGVTIARGSVINVDWGVAFASVALVPRLLESKWFFAPQLALWFVGLLAQYYLLFPLLFVLMRRLGVALFLVATFGLTVGANWWVVDRYGAPEFQFAMVTGWAPFRLFEFTAGMGIGWLLAAPEHERARWLTFARHPLAVVAALLLGFAAHTAGDLLIGEWTARYWQAMALPLVTLGLALLALPLLVKRPSRVDASAPVRAIAWVGVISYGVLIVNDAMRLVASQLRIEQAGDGAWWAFLVAVYVPASIALAWPLSWALGLLPKRAPRPPREAQAAHPREPEEALAGAMP